MSRQSAGPGTKVTTRSSAHTVQARIDSDPAFKAALLAEGVNALFEGDVDTGKAALRDYIDATIGFAALAEAIGTRPEALRRIFSAGGNPSANSLFAVIHGLQTQAGVKLQV